MEKKDPIIIIGAGRTGSTTFHHMLSKHPDLAWLPGKICKLSPGGLALNRVLMRGLDYPVVGRFLNITLKPGECYGFWEYHCKGFSAPYRDLLADDVTEKTKRRVRDTMSKVLTEERNRLLLKITGWPRIGFLSEIFEDAKFVHMMRDGRAVANSMLDVHFWRGWAGPQNWGWGDLAPAQREQWYRYGQSFVVLAALQWRILMDAIEDARRSVDSEHFLEFRYEDLCSDPINTVKKVTAFCGLEWTVDFQRQLAAYQLKNTNDKFKSDLTTKQQSDLENVLGDCLTKYGYL
jgi:hypothetical protein